MRRFLAFWDFSRFSVHGDIQAVFEFDPPRSVMDQIYAAEDTSGQIPYVTSQDFALDGKPPARSPLSRGKTRKDSFGTVAGLTEHLSEFLHEHGGGDIRDRLEALEETTNRMEALLIKLGQNMGDDDSDRDPAMSRALRDHTNALGEAS
ncbi:hypothetical protein N7G274_010818 [Stereocaulon virgatum]|uniref:Uncharacterized protein n=1 Tax=Stereocaulon virgatum TaxID=373712 RepID=A0ABR3ZUT0_9LECA